MRKCPNTPCPLLDIRGGGWMCDPTPLASGIASLLYESALGAQQYAYIFVINQSLNLCFWSRTASMDSGTLN